MRAEIGNFTFSTIADVGSRTGGSFSLRDAQTDVIVALWGSLSWLDKVGRDTGIFIFSYTTCVGGRRKIDRTLYNSDYCSVGIQSSF